MNIKMIFRNEKQNNENNEGVEEIQILKSKQKEKEGKFLEVICRRCGNKQIIYGKSTTDVKCLKCNKLLAKTAGGKARIVTFIRRVLIWK